MVLVVYKPEKLLKHRHRKEYCSVINIISKDNILGDFIVACLASVMRQTLTNIEL